MAAESTALVSITPEAQELIQFAGTFLATATALQIRTPEEAAAAVEQTRAIKECATALQETRFGYTRPLDAQKDAYMDLFRPAADSLGRAEKLLKGVIGAWNTEQARIAAEAEKESQRLTKIEKDKQDADAARALQDADAARAPGDYAAAEALEEQAATLQDASPVTRVNYGGSGGFTKTKGSSSRTIWKCKVVDPSKVPAAYLMPNQVLLDALATTAKGVGAAPAGCEWVSNVSTSIR